MLNAEFSHAAWLHSQDARKVRFAAAHGVDAGQVNSWRQHQNERSLTYLMALRRSPCHTGLHTSPNGPDVYSKSHQYSESFVKSLDNCENICSLKLVYSESFVKQSIECETICSRWNSEKLHMNIAGINQGLLKSHLYLQVECENISNLKLQREQLHTEECILYLIASSNQGRLSAPGHCMQRYNGLAQMLSPEPGQWNHNGAVSPIGITANPFLKHWPKRGGWVVFLQWGLVFAL